MHIPALAVEIPSNSLLFLHFCLNNLWHTHTHTNKFYTLNLRQLFFCFSLLSARFWPHSLHFF